MTARRTRRPYPTADLSDPGQVHLHAAILADVRAARRPRDPWAAVLATVAAAVAVAVATWPWAGR